MVMNISMIKAVDNMRSILIDFLSVPKTMGKGPMITAPPPLTFPSPLMIPKNRRRTATKAVINPAKTKMTPTSNNNWPLILWGHFFKYLEVKEFK